MIVVSGFQALRILKDWKSGMLESAASLDLGVTTSKVALMREFALFPDGQKLDYNILEKMSGEEHDCFYLEGNQAFKIECYSEDSRKFFQLYATGQKSAPTAVISGIRMHQTKSMNPIEDTLLKVNSIKISGLVLDTCMGLGYTAIYAKRKGAEKVITVEREPVMVEIAKLNPWSRELFDENGIEIIKGDTSEIIKGFEDESFDAVIHDPPRLSLSGNLYSLDYYRELYRVLKKGRMLFHYVGSPGGRYRGKNLALGVRKRLLEAGFQKVEEYEKAQGVRAIK